MVSQAMASTAYPGCQVDVGGLPFGRNKKNASLHLKIGYTPKKGNDSSIPTIHFQVAMLVLGRVVAMYEGGLLVTIWKLNLVKHHPYITATDETSLVRIQLSIQHAWERNKCRSYSSIGKYGTSEQLGNS